MMERLDVGSRNFLGCQPDRHGCDCSKRIAERAFRYGAERHALWVKSVGDAAANVVPQMSPAPAEEKCPVCWPAHKGTGSCNCGCHIGLGYAVTDRRLVRRRK